MNQDAYSRIDWVRGRLARAAAIRAGAIALAAGLAAVVLASVVTRLVRGESLGAAWLGAPLAFAAIVSAVAAWRGRPSRLRAAIALDQRLGLAECVSTAVAFEREACDASLKDVLDAQARERIAACTPERLAKAFPAPRPWDRLAAALLFAVAFFVVPLLPTFVKVPLGPTKDDPAKAAQEQQQVREAARRLEKAADEVARIAERRRLESVRALAREASKESQELGKRPPPKRDALARLSKLSDSLKSEAQKSLGLDLANAGSGSDPLEDLARMADALDRLDPERLDGDLESLRGELESEAKASRAEGRAPRVDSKKLEELLARADRLEKQLERLERLLAENPELRERLERALKRQSELAKKSRRDLERLSGA